MQMVFAQGLSAGETLGIEMSVHPGHRIVALKNDPQLFFFLVSGVVKRNWIRL